MSAPVQAHYGIYRTPKTAGGEFIEESGGAGRTAAEGCGKQFAERGCLTMNVG